MVQGVEQYSSFIVAGKYGNTHTFPVFTRANLPLRSPGLPGLPALDKLKLRFGKDVPRDASAYKEPAALFLPNDKPEAIRERVSAWLAQAASVEAEAVADTPGFPFPYFKRLASKQIIGAGLPQATQGANLNTPQVAAVLESLFHYAPNAGSWAGMNSYLAALPIAMAGTELQKKAFLPGLATGSRIATLGIMKGNNPGSDPEKIDTEATYDPAKNEWTLNKGHLFIPNGEIADTVLVLAKTPVGEEEGKTKWADVGFIIDNFHNNPHITVEAKTGKPGFNAVSGTEISFNNLRLPANRLLGGAKGFGKGLSIALDTMSAARIADAAMLTGNLRSTFDKTFFFASSWIQRETPILNDANIYRRLSVLAREHYASRALVANAAGIREKYLQEQHNNTGNALQHQRKHMISAAVASLNAREIIEQEAMESERVMTGIRFAQPLETEELLSARPRIFPSIVGTKDLQQLVINQGIRDSVAEDVADGHLRNTYARDLNMYMRLRLYPSKKPGKVAEDLVAVADYLMDKTIAFATTTKVLKASPILAYPSQQSGKTSSPQTPLQANTGPAGLKKLQRQPIVKVYRPLTQDGRAIFHLAEMYRQLTKMKATLDAAQQEKHNPTAPIIAKMVALEGVEKLIIDMREIYKVGKSAPDSKVLRLAQRRIPQFALAGGTTDENNRQILKYEIQKYKDQLMSRDGQAQILAALTTEYQSQAHVAMLHKAFKSIFQTSEKFYKAMPNAAVMTMVKFIIRTALPTIFKIKNFDFPNSERDSLKAMVNDYQVFLAPHHPTGMVDTLIEAEIQGRISPPGLAKFTPVIYMTAREKFKEAYGPFLPRVGCFSVTRGGETNDSQNYMVAAAKKGKSMIVVSPRGEAEFLNHHILPFKYGVANAAVEAATSGQARKPIVIAPLAMALHYTDSIQEAMEARLNLLEARMSLPNPRNKHTVSTQDQAERLKHAYAVFMQDTIHNANETTPHQPPLVLPHASLVQQIEWMKKNVLEHFEMKYFREIHEGSQLTRVRALMSYLKRKTVATDDEKEKIAKDLLTARVTRDFQGIVPEAFEHLDNLTQDQFAEFFVKLEEALIKPGLKNLHADGFENFGPRKATIRLTEPLYVNRWLHENRETYPNLHDPEQKKAAAEKITRLMEKRMQDKLDSIYADLNHTNSIRYPNFINDTIR